MSGHLVLLSGAVSAGFAIAGLFFLRFWSTTRDSLFLIFAIAFWLFAANQVLSGLYDASADKAFAIYSLRLAGFVLIAVAIAIKNLGKR